MAYKLIKIPDATIVVSDEEKPKAGDYSINMESKIVQLNQSTCIFYDFKIIAGLQNLPAIKYNLSNEDANKIGWVDVEKLAEQYAEHQLKGISDKTSKFECINDFTAGFEKANELNNKKFSEYELLMVSNYLNTDSLDEILKFLKKPQIFDCEIEITDCVTLTKIL